MQIKSETTRYGFIFGAAEVQRATTDDRTGAVTLALKTPKGDYQIYVTKTGKVRIWNPENVEMVPCTDQ